MALNFNSFSKDKNRSGSWKIFLLFLIFCLLFVILLIYFLLPGFFLEPIIEKIPIIIERQTDEVINIYGNKYT